MMVMSMQLMVTAMTPLKYPLAFTIVRIVDPSLSYS